MPGDPQIEQLTERLAATNNLHEWGAVANTISGSPRRAAFDGAIPLWTRRMIAERQLLLHPTVIKQLRDQDWCPNDLQKQMIWASIVCKLDSPDQQDEKRAIRELLKEKHGNAWWEAVYKRAGEVWPAWDRARKRVFSQGPAATLLASKSVLVGQALDDEYQAALRMVPSS